MGAQKIITLAFFLWALAMSQARAHPHSWIDVISTAVVDKQGRMTALKQHWIFDQYYTAFVLDEVRPDIKREPTREKLIAMANDNLKNLKAYDYFTVIKSSGKKVDFASLGDIESTIEGKQLTLSFTLHFAEPVFVKEGVEYRIFDPSYYIEMLHHSRQDARVEGAACAAQLIAPNPTALQTTLAAALDRNAKAPDNLGEMFAQTVRVSCP